jgi:ethanolamine ammonia-lyase small subunit
VTNEPDDLGASAGSSGLTGTEPEADWPEIVRRVQARTPARLLAGRSGAAYRTNTQLELRQAHAAAHDAVRAELNLKRHLGEGFLERWKLFEVSTQATGKDEYLLRPDLGRCFSESTRAELLQRCSPACDMQIVIGDGLSVTAVAKQAPPLFELLHQHAKERGWTLGQPFVVRHCRVGILNEIGSLFAPQVVVLLIGERPGLATAESLSAYLAHRPQKSHTDADRNLISNIHARGVSMPEAARRIIHLAEKIMRIGASGYRVREEWPASENIKPRGQGRLITKENG